MKGSTLTTKLLTNFTALRSAAVRSIATVALAGSAIALTTSAASAQRFSIGVGFGGPRYVAPLPPPAYGYGYGYGYYGPRHYDGDWRAHEAWVRHEEWQRFHREPYGYGPRPWGARPY